MPDGDDKGPKVQTLKRIAMVPDKGTPAVQLLRESIVENTTRTLEVGESNNVENQKNSLVSNLRELPKETLAILVKDCEDREQANNVKGGCRHGAMETRNTEVPQFKFEHMPKDKVVRDFVGSDTTTWRVQWL